MKRIIIICEGQTEQQYCNDSLYHYFLAQDIVMQAPVIKHSKGGITSWNIIKKEINRYLKKDVSAYLTTFIDYYGIRKRHKFPKWEESYDIPDNHKPERMDFLENAMREDLDEGIRDRFIPYIQLHEFEGLLFSNPDVFDKNFEPSEFADRTYLDKTLEEFNHLPEFINDGATTAPSKRLERILNIYSSEKESVKATLGSLIADEIGLATIRHKCPRFNTWITKLENI